MASASRVNSSTSAGGNGVPFQRWGIEIERFGVPLDSGDDETRTLERLPQGRTVVPMRWRCLVRRQQARRRPAGEKPETDSGVHDVGHCRHHAAVGAQVLAERCQHPDRIPHVLEQPHGDNGVELRTVERRVEIQCIGIADDDAVREGRGSGGASCRVSTTDTRHPTLESVRDSGHVSRPMTSTRLCGLTSWRSCGLDGVAIRLRPDAPAR